MPIFACWACGTTFPDSAAEPETCPICTDERQFVPPSGQRWTDLRHLRQQHSNAWRAHGPDLMSLATTPAFAIGQRAFLVRTTAGLVLWDCVTLLDDATVELVTALGGLVAIAISHPHYYSAMTDWADAFDAPVYLHEADASWIMRPSPRLRLWSGDTMPMTGDATLLRLGGHFAGGTVLHRAARSDAAATLLTGDVITVSPGADRVSFLWSYPNRLPLPGAAVRRIAKRLAPWPFDRMFSAFDGQNVLEGADAIVARSADRYLAILAADPDALASGSA